MLRTWFGLVFVGFGLTLIVSTLARAEGNNGQCFGTWEQYWSQTQQQWVTIAGSFKCEPDSSCPGVQECNLFVVSDPPTAYPKKRICACQGDSGWQIDTLIVSGHTPAIYCSETKVELSPSVEGPPECTQECPPGEDCEEQPGSVWWVENQQTWHREMACDCQ